MIVGYARTSTVEQQAGLDAQIQELKTAGCTKIFEEQVSSSSVREKLQLALDFVREDDVFVVTKLDRLARSVKDLMRIIDVLQKKQVSLKILNLGLDTETATGKLILTILASIAQFERELMLERQREGIARAKSQGKYKGRKRIPETIHQSIFELNNKGWTKKKIASELNIGEATVYRVLARKINREC